jgi:hypothetical protein
MKPPIAVPLKGRVERGSNNGLRLGGEASYASPTARPASLSSLKHDPLRGLNGNDSLHDTMTIWQTALVVLEVQLMIFLWTL